MGWYENFLKPFSQKDWFQYYGQIYPINQNWLFTDKSGLATANLLEFSTKFKKWTWTKGPHYWVGEGKIFGLGMREKRRMRRHFWSGENEDKRWWWMGNRMGIGIVVTTGIKPSSNIGSALVSAIYDRSIELGLYLRLRTSVWYSSNWIGHRRFYRRFMWT